MEGKSQGRFWVVVLSIALLLFLSFSALFLLIFIRDDEDSPWVGSPVDLYKAVGSRYLVSI